jgi:hypothetical protein
MLESVSTDSRHYPQVRGARFAEGGGRFTGMPRMTLRLSYLTWKLRALCWVLRRLRAGGVRVEYKKAPDLAARRELCDQTGGRRRKLGGNQARMNKAIFRPILAVGRPER